MDIRIRILYDNSSNPNRHDLQNGWGFSAFIETPHHNILFDTGWHPDILQHNAKLMGIDLSITDILIISHQHWDHAGGLAGILKLLKAPKIYLPDGYSKNQTNEIKRLVPNARIENISNVKLIEVAAPRLALSGSLKTDIGLKEQGLLIEINRDEAILIVGCSHPGLESYINSFDNFKHSFYASLAPVRYIIGGLHGFNNIEYLENEQIKKVFVGHCTKHKDIFRNSQSIDSSDFYVGCDFNFSLDIAGLFKEGDPEEHHHHHHHH